jgi:MFS family permease
VLARGPVRRLLGAQFLSQAADGLYQIALASILIFNVAAAETPAQVTKVLAVTLLPFSLIGPFTGPFIDRFSRRSILVGASAIRALTTAALVPAIGGPEWLLLALAVANISVNRFFHATKAAVLPTLVRSDRYLTANAVSTTGGMVFGLLGAVIGGPIAQNVSATAVVVAASVVMGVAGAMAATLALPPGERRGLAGVVREIRDNLRDVGNGLRTLRASRRATYGVAAVWTMRALLGFVLIAALVLLRTRFQARVAGFSVILGMVGVGGFLGAVTVGGLARRTGYTGVAPVAFVVAGLVALLLGPAPTWPVVLGVVLVAGAAMAATKIASDTLVQSGIEDHFRGRAFSVYDIGYNGMFVIAALIPTLILPAVGEVGMIVITAALAVAAAGWLSWWRRRVPPSVDVAAYAGGRADEAPREITLDGVRHVIEDIERSWTEERGSVRLRCFRIRTSSGRRIEISTDGTSWTTPPS